LFGYAGVIHRETELVALYRRAGVLRVVACLNHLTLIGLEHESFLLEVVDIPFVNALAIYKIELDYIPKSKVREKIEELKQERECEKCKNGLEISRSGFINGKIMVLQELLEERN
jgi:hypothetical protein